MSPEDDGSTTSAEKVGEHLDFAERARTRAEEIALTAEVLQDRAEGAQRFAKEAMKRINERRTRKPARP
ncbi:hypothetical protein GCM10010166_37810 [Couchioplanes caeruleus subsp. azureus]|nr:hypothetical protein GCM10010166_37810 [Couchioplanes caeruleus subsp. azureus]